MRYASIAPMNKTIYLREEEVPIWERAREMSGDKLSPVIVTALKRYIADMEGKNRGYERIVVDFNDALNHHLPKSKAFFGRWIIGPAEPYRLSDEDGNEYDIYTVAETAKGNVVVTKYTESREGRTGVTFLVYGSFQEAAANPNINVAVREAVERRGVATEELDI
jgi:hypothetical protein